MSAELARQHGVFSDAQLDNRLTKGCLGLAETVYEVAPARAVWKAGLWGSCTISHNDQRVELYGKSLLAGNREKITPCPSQRRAAPSSPPGR